MGMDDIGESTCTEIQHHMIGKFDLGFNPEDHGSSGSTSIGAYAVTFADHGFATLRKKPSRHNARIVRYFTPVRQNETIPEIGATLGWSKGRTMPLDWVLSITASRSSRAPTNSVRLLSRTLNGIVISEIPGERYSRGEPKNSRLNTLINRGILVEDESHSRFKIKDPTYSGPKPFERLRFETQHLYTSLQVAKEFYPDRDWSCDELLVFSTNLLPQNLRNNEQLIDAIRQRITKAAAIKYPREHPGAINKIDISKRRVRVADQYQEDVSDLLERIDRLKTSPSSRKAYKDDAYDIYGDAETAKALIVKGHTASPYSPS